MTALDVYSQVHDRMDPRRASGVSRFMCSALFHGRVDVRPDRIQVAYNRAQRPFAVIEAAIWLSEHEGEWE